MTRRSQAIERPPVALDGTAKAGSSVKSALLTPLHPAGKGKSPCPPHWWVIDTPNGATCHAQCRKCKARRTYDAVGAYEGVWSPTGGKKKAPR